NQSAVLPAGNYVADTFTMSGSARLTAKGAVRIWIRRELNLTGHPVLSASSQRTSDLWLIATPEVRRADLNGQPQFNGVLYAPSTPIQISGSCNISGALIGSEIVMSGANELHFDENLIEGSLMQPLPVPPRSR